jgi:invasion protein IalB
MRRYCRKALLFLCCVIALPAMAAAQSEDQSAPKQDLAGQNAKQTKQEVGDWGVECAQKVGEAPRCKMFQHAVSAKARKAVLTWQLGRDAAGNQVMSFQTPSGLLLPEGVQMAIDDQPPMVIPFRTCLGQICEAVVPLSEGLVRAMQAGRKATVTVTSLEGKPATLAMSLKGFSGAYKIFAGKH